MNDRARHYDQIRRSAAHWIRRAGVLARQRLGTAVATQKADDSPVTDVDMAVQAMLLDAIAQQYPDDAVITEELIADPDRHAAVATAKRCWVIDPIDGTRNYARGMPVFAISVALLEAGVPVVGLVHNPMTAQMYSASIGGGAWLDDERLAVQDEFRGQDVFIGVPTNYRDPLPPVVKKWLEGMILRNFGSTELHLCLVATGSFDAAYCERCKLWDIAAGAVMCAETGAEIRKPTGQSYFPFDLATYQNEPTPFLAARPPLLDRLLADLQHP